MFNKLFSRKEQKDEGIKFSSAPKIRVEGKDYSCRIDSINTIQKAESMQIKVQKLVTDDSNAKTSEIIDIIIEFVVLILGEEGYNTIFDTKEKKDNYTWHLQVFGELFRIIYTYKNQMFDDVVNSPVIEQLKKIQKENSR